MVVIVKSDALKTKNLFSRNKNRREDCTFLDLDCQSENGHYCEIDPMKWSGGHILILFTS